MIDGDFLPHYPSKALSNGAFARVPIIIGTNTGRLPQSDILGCQLTRGSLVHSDEGTLFTPPNAPFGVANDEEFESLLSELPMAFK